MDPFSKLPPRILLSILKSLHDLTSMANLDRASPASALLFDECGAEIIEAIITAHLPEAIQVLIRIIVIIRSKSIPSRSLDEFVETYVRRDEPCKDPAGSSAVLCNKAKWPSRKDGLSDTCNSCGLLRAPFPIKKSTSISVLRGILVLASQIQQITFNCLQVMIDRCMALQPSHLLDPKFKYRFLHTALRKYPQRRPEGKVYQPPDTGPPYWLEEQRVSRALWRIQLYFDLKDAETDPDLGWICQGPPRLQVVDVEEFWEDFGDEVLEHLKTVVQYLKEQPGTCGTHGSESGRLIALPFPTAHAQIHWPRPNTSDELSFETYFGTATCSFQKAQQAPWRRFEVLRDVDFNFYRPLGFYIWHKNRMGDLGFLNYPKSHPLYSEDTEMTEFQICFTWMSILDEETADALERQRLEEFPEEYRFDNPGVREAYFWDISPLS